MCADDKRLVCTEEEMGVDFAGPAVAVIKNQFALLPGEKQLLLVSSPWSCPLFLAQVANDASVDLHYTFIGRPCEQKWYYAEHNAATALPPDACSGDHDGHSTNAEDLAERARCGRCQELLHHQGALGGRGECECQWWEVDVISPRSKVNRIKLWMNLKDNVKNNNSFRQECQAP
jgi:hypothetical protein